MRSGWYDGMLFFLLCVFRFLGHLYAAEALISLDRISDAISHLNPENVSDVSVGVLTSEQDQGLLLSSSLNTLKASLVSH